MAAEDWTPEKVRSVLTGESPGLVSQRRAFRRIPSSPRCKLCAAPFGGLGGFIFRHAGYRQSAGNPALCTRCITVLRKRQMTGVVIPVSLLFSDIRGSTAMGERMRPADFHAFLDRFYRLASSSIVAHDGIVDKVVGDEVIGLFFGGITGTHHPAAAVAAAIDLQELLYTQARPSLGRPALAQLSRTSLRSVMSSTSRRDWHRLRLQAR